MAWSPPRGISLHEAYYDVTTKITHRNWNRFARTALKLEQHDLDMIKADYPKDASEQKIQMLQKWAQDQGSHASVTLLYDTLNHFLFPNKCPAPASCPIATGKLPKRGKLDHCSADAVGFAGEVERMDISDDQHRNDIPLAEYCSQVTGINITPCSREFFDREREYESNYAWQKGRGNVLIINNMFAHTPESSRQGSERDVDNMKELWEKLGCNVLVKKDLYANDIIKVLKMFSEQSVSYRYCAVFIMTHGKEDVVLGNDNKEIPYRNILEMFNNENSRVLQEIPKLFFFQCCRGNVPDRGVPVSSKDWREPQKEIGKNVPDSSPIGEMLPTTSDMLISYATQHGRQAFRHTEHGSWFINAIANVFMRDAKTEHVADLLTKVNRSVFEKSGTDGDQDIKAMSHYESNLTKKLYLYPGF